MAAKESGKLWGGRFTGGLDPLMTQYNESIYHDRIFYKQDLRGSIAWARANQRVGILSESELEQIVSGLEQVEREWAHGEFKIVPGIDEDIHTANERRLSEIIGKEIGGKLHTGYAHGFASDAERLVQVIRRTNKSPLGCGALAGNPFGIDRDLIAKELGFDGLLMNSLSAVGDRKFVVEMLQWAAELMTDISRISEDLIIYGTAEFGFVQLADAYSTGSSLMPQKKNSDSLELLRGKSGRVIGQMVGLTCTTKSLPSTYNKDLQESIEPMLDCIKTVGDSVRILTGVVKTLAVNRGKMAAAITPDMLATDLADYLVRKGVPFRETHHISGQVVALAESKEIAMDKLSSADLQSIDTRLGDDFEFDFVKSVELRTAKGGTSLSSVTEQIQHIKALIDGQSSL